MRTPHLDRERGSATVELILLAPLLIALALAVFGFGRLSSARLELDGVAAQAARAAANARSPTEATATAHQIAAPVLSGTSAVPCEGAAVDVDVSGFGPGGWVAVEITCEIDLSRLSGLALPATKAISSRSVAAVDIYRATTP